MSTETVTTLICDRCGVRETPVVCRLSELRLTWSGHQGGRTPQGDYGGRTIKGSADLCEPCANAFLRWIESAATGDSGNV